MIHSKVWENEKYRIEIDGDRVYVTEKETGMNLANTIRIGDHSLHDLYKTHLFIPSVGTLINSLN